MTARRLYVLGMASMCALACSSCGPHMLSQPAIRPYKQQMPTMPANSVPVTGKLASTTTTQAALTASPTPPTPNNLKNGQIYYGYYCLMCHGQNGKGDGPVGQSYVPKPTDLTSPAVTSMTDGQLYRGMLRGVGHDPVMDQTVIPAHRWPIVLYTKSLGRAR